MILKENATFVQNKASNICLVEEHILVTGKASILLEMLLKKETEHITYEDIAKSIWEKELTPKVRRSIDVHVYKVRKAVEQYGYTIETKRSESIALIEKPVEDND